MDKSVVLGYSRIGPVLRQAWWPADAKPNALAGRHVVVTGASGGLGAGIAAGCARLGATVHLVGRDKDRLDESARTIRSSVAPATDLVTEVCDISDLDSVRDYAADLSGRISELHGLVHNAGVLPPERRESPQGHELVYATHVLGPSLLTHLLRPVLAADGDARVVWMSSGGMYTRPLDTTDIEATQREWSGTDAYARTKRMQVVLAQMWSDRMRVDHIAVHSMHPGWSDTPGIADALPGFHRVIRPALRTTEQGADTAVWLVSAPGGSVTAGASGVFWSDRRPRPLTYAPWQKETPGERARLWEAVGGAIGVDVA
ncbi:MAG: SDR family NAD(P)-dependent oxidoreductase [Nocardioidaceae bacterium]|nr:SDR family NAD(P)-dependent oxidoreductase [Nocardioidaceae bacterium]